MTLLRTRMIEDMTLAGHAARTQQIYLQADKSVDYGLVAETMAEVRAAGIDSIGLVTIPKTQ